MNHSLSIVVPALNEEKNLRRTINTIVQALQEESCDYEIIIINDGSTDNTGPLADTLAKENQNIRTIHHSKPQGRGATLNEGLSLANNDLLTWINGKCDTTASEFRKLISHAGQADLIISYQNNTHERPLVRATLSRLYVFLLNHLFGLGLKYYNGSTLVPKHCFNKIHVKTSSYAYEAELLIKLLNRGHSYVEVGVRDIFEKGRKTRSFSLKNIFGVVKFIFVIFWEIKISPKFNIRR